MNDTNDPSSRLSGDRPLKSIEDDQFGLKTIVEVIAANLTRNITIGGYTIGLEGNWGSGKTTLANFVMEKVKKDDSPIKVIRFDPWLIGNKSAFIPSFLGDLATSVDEYEQSTKRWWHIIFWIKRKFGRGIAAKITRYGKFSLILSSTTMPLASIDPTGAAAVTAVGLRGFGEISKFFGSTAKAIPALKSDISAALLKLSAHNRFPRFVVVVDDSDRLEPPEALEILRLIREVADFPLITYLVCFDKKILEQQVCNVLRISEGAEYIEKMFNQIISLPPQEPFALRRQLTNLLRQSFPAEFTTVDQNEKDYGYRKYLLFDVWTGTLLKTPRDVVRLTDAIKFGWVYLPATSDFIDFGWLQLVKLKAPDLYRFVQSYLVNVGAFRDGGRPGDNEPEEQAKTLSDIMQNLGWGEHRHRSGIGEFLPGVNRFVLEGENKKVFQFESGELAHFEKNRRLGSPSHWRQYFSFSLPTYALSDEEIAEFRKAAALGGAEASAKLVELLGREHTRPGHYVDVLFDRLNDLPDNALTDQENRGIGIALSDIMDDVVTVSQEFVNSGHSDIWSNAVKLLKRGKAAHFRNLVKNGRAIGWLSEVLRGQGFAHGRPDGNRANSERQWLDDKQLEGAIASLLNRLKKMGFDSVFRSPSPLDILYLWHQLGDATELRRLLSRWTKGDTQFLKAMTGMQGWSNSSETGIGHPLRRSTVAAFMDADGAKSRLQKLTVGESAVNSTTLQAQSLLAEWEDDFRRESA